MRKLVAFSVVILVAGGGVTVMAQEEVCWPRSGMPASPVLPEKSGSQRELLFTNGTMGHDPPSDIGTEMTNFTAAEDFEVIVAGRAAAATFGLADYSCTGLANWDGTLRWWILTDDGQKAPYALVATGAARDILLTLVDDDCDPWGVAWYSVSFDLGLHPTLEPGARYWLALHMADDWEGSDGLGWAWTSPGHFQPGMTQEGETGSWTSTLYEHAFNLSTNPNSPYIFVDDFERGSPDAWSDVIGGT